MDDGQDTLVLCSRCGFRPASRDARDVLDDWCAECVTPEDVLRVLRYHGEWESPDDVDVEIELASNVIFGLVDVIDPETEHWYGSVLDPRIHEEA